MAAREFLWLVVESAYGVTKTSPVAGTDSIFIRLSGSNSFSMRPKQMAVKIAHGGGTATNSQRIADWFELKGSLTTELYVAQAPILLPWLITPINAGRTLPWTTTDASALSPPGDLASVSIYHAITRPDGTIKRKKYLGCKAKGFSVTGGRDKQIFTLKVDIQAILAQGNVIDSSSDPTSGAFAAPADSAYPINPYVWSNVGAAGLSIASARATVSSFELSVKNKMYAQAYTGKFIQRCNFLGRESTMKSRLLLLASPDDRAVYEANTAQTVTTTLTNGANTCAFAFNANNFADDVADQLDIDKTYEQELTLDNNYDPAASADLSVATT